MKIIHSVGGHSWYNLVCGILHVTVSWNNIRLKRKTGSFLVCARVAQYLPHQVCFFPCLAGVIIFVISVFRPQEVAMVAAADSILYFVLDDMIYSGL